MQTQADDIVISFAWRTTLAGKQIKPQWRLNQRNDRSSESLRNSLYTEVRFQWGRQREE